MSQRDLPTSRNWRLRPTEHRPLLIAGDFISGLIALTGALVLWSLSSGEWFGFSRDFLLERVPNWFFLVPFIWLILLVETYDIHRARRIQTTLQGIGFAAIMGLTIYMVVYFSSPPRSLPRSAVGYFLLLVSIMTFFWRVIYIRVFTGSAFLQRVLIVGAGRAGSAILERINELDKLPFDVVGLIDDDAEKIGQTIQGYKVLGSSKNLMEILESRKVTDLIVAISGRMEARMFQALLDAHDRGVDISRMQKVYEELFGRVPIFHLESDWMIRSFIEESRVSGFYLLSKRLLDIVGGLIGVIGVITVIPFVVIANLLETGFPIFYYQTRSGQNHSIYEIIKFRTMQIDAEMDGQPRWTSENDKRVTRVGWFLRKTHLDELPQFLNVLKGDMSLVGPRPERPKLIEVFQKEVPFYQARLLVKPGITGWAQIHQNYAANIEETNEKLEYDLYYIKERNLLLDLLVLLRTPSTVLGLRGR